MLNIYSHYRSKIIVLHLSTFSQSVKWHSKKLPDSGSLGFHVLSVGLEGKKIGKVHSLEST
jgi:hypothetical protein